MWTDEELNSLPNVGKNSENNQMIRDPRINKLYSLEETIQKSLASPPG
ncbi:hypothetical protein [Methanolobus halotolerans]|nr:hypothetical protein [Methanolobus halotolerans]